MSVIGKIDVTTLASGMNNIMVVEDSIKKVFGDYPIRERGITPTVDQIIFETVHYAVSSEGTKKVIDRSEVVNIDAVDEFFFKPDDKFYLRFKYSYNTPPKEDMGTVVTTIEPVNLVDSYRWKNLVALVYAGDPDSCVSYAKSKLRNFYLGGKFYKMYKAYTNVCHQIIKNNDELFYNKVIVVAYSGTELPPTADLKEFTNSLSAMMSFAHYFDDRGYATIKRGEFR